MFEIEQLVTSAKLKLQPDDQSSISCGTAGPAVIDSEQPSSIIKGANIRSFVAKSVLSRFTRFLVVTAQTKHCQIGQLHD